MKLQPNAGNFQEYDYEQEHIECDWKIIYKTNHLVTSKEVDTLDNLCYSS